MIELLKKIFGFNSGNKEKQKEEIDQIPSRLLEEIQEQKNTESGECEECNCQCEESSLKNQEDKKEESNDSNKIDSAEIEEAKDPVKEKKPKSTTKKKPAKDKGQIEAEEPVKKRGRKKKADS